MAGALSGDAEAVLAGVVDDGDDVVGGLGERDGGGRWSTARFQAWRASSQLTSSGVTMSPSMRWRTAAKVSVLCSVRMAGFTACSLWRWGVRARYEKRSAPFVGVVADFGVLPLDESAAARVVLRDDGRA